MKPNARFARLKLNVDYWLMSDQAGRRAGPNLNDA